MSHETAADRPGEKETSVLGPGGGQPFPGEYRLVRKLGGGAFGEVWLADDLSPLGWQVALKFLRARPDRLELARTALANEARALAALRHPNVVQVLAWKTVPASGLPCLVMQYVAGGSLDARVEREGPLPWPLAARYVADVADGLLAVHAKGVIHRDVKPANLLWQPEGDEALLADFGIAARLTDSGTAAGTRRFMAPEAFHGDVSPALDVYGLAASLFWLLVGKAPFPDADLAGQLLAVERGLPPGDARFVGVPAPLEGLIRAGLAYDPRRRPELTAFGRELRGALNNLLADCLTLPAPAGAARVELVVSRRAGPGFEPLARSAPERAPPRDGRRVPAAPERVTVRTGERVRIEARADQPGHLAVFNVGPTGNLNLLGRAAPGEALAAFDVELTPPAGRERVFAVWTRGPLPLRPEDLRSLAEDTEPAGRAYGATRDMVRVGQSLRALPEGDRQVVVLELDHRP